MACCKGVPMTKITKWQLLLFVLLLVSLFGQEAGAQTINAANCSSSAVQTALNSVAADGTTVVIPSCSATTWTTAVTYNQVYSTVLQGQSTTTGTCAPGGSCTATDNTIITDNVSGPALTIDTASGKSFRMTGLTFNPSSGTAAYGAITIGGSSTSVRVDHNHFNDTVSGDHTFQIDAINGVFDHNFFDSTNQANLFFFQFTNEGASTYGHESWAQPDNFGTSKFLFVENNFFQNGAFAFDCFAGGRLVFRYNSVGTNTRIQTHGLTGDIHRSCRTEEVYENTFTFSSNPSSLSFAFLVDYEGGSGLWWGNTITGFVTFLREDVVRTNIATYTEASTPNGWGYCGTILGPSNWDQNSNSTGYPCLDQIGRGAGDLLTGDFPNVVDSATGTITWPHQASDPVYVWGNTFNTSSYAPSFYWSNFDSVSVENRDYYLQLPNYNETATFNGTAGIGQGLASAKPSTCTPSVGWWATDTNTLYRCATTNTWAPYYTPYTYPHPLTQGSSSSGTLPSAPTNLTAAVQ
jgi:hypothetical protein